MKTFHCSHCGNVLFFENVKCVKCGHVLGFLPPPIRELDALEPAGENKWRSLHAETDGELYRSCANSIQHQVCNWLVAANDPEDFCISCRINEMIPDLDVAGNLDRWQKLETAKRRLFYTIMRLGLPTSEKPEENRPALRFRFIGDTPGDAPALSGHSEGLITVNISEADDPERERRRVNLHEPYRTLLGHFRHEVGHYFWDRLVTRSRWEEGFRNLFGNETTDYQAALTRHYNDGPPPDWQNNYVSAYASAHPWEDWAETWAHYFHIIEMVETAGNFGVAVKIPEEGAKPVAPAAISDPSENFDVILEAWHPLAQTLNSLNRSMGLPDIYPFVLAAKTVEKLRFVHQVATSRRAYR